MRINVRTVNNFKMFWLITNSYIVTDEYSQMLKCTYIFFVLHNFVVIYNIYYIIASRALSVKIFFMLYIMFI